MFTQNTQKKETWLHGNPKRDFPVIHTRRMKLWSAKIFHNQKRVSLSPNLLPETTFECVTEHFTQLFVLFLCRHRQDIEVQRS